MSDLFIFRLFEEVLKSLGLFQIISFVFIVNTPSLFFSMWKINKQNITYNSDLNKIKNDLQIKYITRDELKTSVGDMLKPVVLEIKNIKNSVDEIAKLLQDQVKTTTAHSVKLDHIEKRN